MSSIIRTAGDGRVYGDWTLSHPQQETCRSKGKTAALVLKRPHTWAE